jgi:murein DD-endopeptidase MepM/ murein hydrolase activator NlpD
VVFGRTLPAHVTRVAAAALAAALVAGGAARAASITDTIRAKQAEVHATHAKLEQKRAQLAIARVRVDSLQTQLDETNANIARVSGDLDALTAQVHVSQRHLAWNGVQLSAAQATLARHTDALRGRLVDAYERGDVGYLNVLLSATSFSEFAERWDDIRYLVAQTERTVRERRAAATKVELARRSLEAQRVRLQEAVAVQQQAQAELNGLAQQRSGLLSAAQLERHSVAGQVAQLEELSASEEGALEAMIRERQRQEEERRRAEAEAARRAALLSGKALPPENPGAPGMFSWPASGPITSPFGLRPNPFGSGFETHPGIDIGAPMGATIAAAAGGRVIFAGWYGGYGNAIIIDHGGNTSTVYGHCSQIFVSNGQDVQRGQAIGAVGMTGRATGPHLHFEVRVNGVPVDPTSRLR